MTSPRENSKLIGLSPIFLSIMVASNSAANSRKLSVLSVFSYKKRFLASKILNDLISNFKFHAFSIKLCSIDLNSCVTLGIKLLGV